MSERARASRSALRSDDVAESMYSYGSSYSMQILQQEQLAKTPDYVSPLPEVALKASTVPPEAASAQILEAVAELSEPATDKLSSAEAAGAQGSDADEGKE